MAHKAFLVTAAIAAFFASASASVAFPVAPLHAGSETTTVAKVTFWGKPFPYGYNWRLTRACTRYETVETSRGLVTQRVWVCGGHRREAVVSYKG